jgi:hypothetical protein
VSDRRLYCVDDDVPAQTTDLLATACADRGVEFVRVDAGTFTYAVEDRARPGDLLYRPATSGRAAEVEQFLHVDGVGTFYPEPHDLYFFAGGPQRLFERAGLPMPRTVPCVSADPEWLAAQVETLGGYPVVLKVGGYEGGTGVLLMEGPIGLRSTIGFLLASGRVPALSAFVPDAVHWRVVVVGGRAVAAYRNLPIEQDFRTTAGADPTDYTAEVPSGLAIIACGAAVAVRRELAGVDVLEHPSGRLYLLEANFPCYFPQAQLIAGIDVAGAMVDHLLTKARPAH